MPFEHCQRDESQSPVEFDRVGLGIDDDAEATDIGRHSRRETKDQTEERLAHALPLHALVDGEAGKEKHRQWIAW